MRREKYYLDVNNPLADENGWVYKDVPDQPLWVSHYRPISPAQHRLHSLIVLLLFAVAIGFSIVRYLDHHMTWTDAIFGMFFLVIISHWLGGPLGRLIKYGSVIFVFIYVSPAIAIVTLSVVAHPIVTLHASIAMNKVIAVLSLAVTYLFSAYFLFRWIFPRSYTDY